LQNFFCEDVCVSNRVRLCAVAELPAEGQAREFSVGEHVVCVARVGGKPLALNNVCPHRGGPLAEGAIEGGKVVCPWHQWTFDLATGVAIDPPGAKTEAYPLTLSGEDVLVDL
jgi:nitrite reductase (NADH) small subunit